MHSNDNSVSIYAQSATDLSDDEEQGQQQASRSTPRGLLEVPSNTGIKKSSSSNLVVDQEKKDTVMAFFGGTRWAPVGIYRMTIVVIAYIFWCYSLSSSILPISGSHLPNLQLPIESLGDCQQNMKSLTTMITLYLCIFCHINDNHLSSSPSPQMTRKKKMSLPARLNQSTLTAADELLSGQDEDDLRDVDAMFESLLNNTFDEGEGGSANKRAPNSNSGQQQQQQQQQHLQQQQQQRQQQSGTPSPSPSEYDTACDPWDDY